MLALDVALWVVCLVLVAAGATKLADPAPLAEALGALGVPVGSGAVSARAIGTVEVVVGVAGLVVGGAAIAAIVSLIYLGFAVLVVLARRRGLASCGCFGSRSAPPSPVHVAMNLLCAIAAAVCASGTPRAPIDSLDQVGPRAAVGIGVALVLAVVVLVVDTRSWGATVRPTRALRGKS